LEVPVLFELKMRRRGRTCTYLITYEKAISCCRPSLELGT